MSLLKTKDRDGTERYWTLKEVVQGKPLGHPSHVMFVHFPVAFYVGALAFDIASRAGTFTEASVAATWLLVGALAGSLFAVITGLVDWWGMKAGVAHEARHQPPHPLPGRDRRAVPGIAVAAMERA